MLNSIQIARGFAAILVVCAHANLMTDPQLFGGVLLVGWCGVDFFFVLSGFIIYYANFRYIGNPASFSSYIRKRIGRLIPIYWVYSLIAISVHISIFYLLSKVLITWTDLSVLGIALDAILWPPAALSGHMPILPVAWTLSYELLFYVLFGFAILCGRRVALIIATAWTLLILATTFGFVPDGRGFSAFPLYLIGDLRNLEFLLGCLAGHLFVYHREDLARYGSTFFATGVVFLCLAWANAVNQFVWWPRLEAVQFGVPFFLVVLGLALTERTGAGELRSPVVKAATYLGDASYSIYLTHFVFVVIVTRVATAASLPAGLSFGISVGGSLVLGLAGYRWIEEPLLRRMRDRRMGAELVTTR